MGKKKNKKNNSTTKKDNKKEVLNKTKIQENEIKKEPKLVKKAHRHSPNCKIGKKIKNLTALSILLAGFAIGSIFVDIAQYYKKDGFSALALKSANIINYNGSTWVRYKEPKIVVDVVVSDDCKEECAVVNDLLVNLRAKIPTLEAHRINISKVENANYTKENNITSIPAFLFDDNLKKINFFKEGELFLEQRKDGKVQIKMNELNIKTKKITNTKKEELKNTDSTKKTKSNEKPKKDKTKHDNNKPSAVSI